MKKKWFIIYSYIILYSNVAERESCIYPNLYFTIVRASEFFGNKNVNSMKQSCLKTCWTKRRDRNIRECSSFERVSRPQIAQSAKDERRRCSLHRSAILWNKFVPSLTFLQNINKLETFCQLHVHRSSNRVFQLLSRNCVYYSRFLFIYFLSTKWC